MADGWPAHALYRDIAKHFAYLLSDRDVMTCA